MKKIIALISVVILALALAGCGYNEHYTSIVMISSEGNNEAFMTFGSFEGTRVLDLRNSNKKKDTLYYSASLKKGKATVYYDYDGTKKELFKIKAGETIDDSIADLELNKVYVIIESDGNCEDGDFRFKIDK